MELKKFHRFLLRQESKIWAFFILQSCFLTRAVLKGFCALRKWKWKTEWRSQTLSLHLEYSSYVTWSEWLDFNETWCPNCHFGARMYTLLKRNEKSWYMSQFKRWEPLMFLHWRVKRFCAQILSTKHEHLPESHHILLKDHSSYPTILVSSPLSTEFLPS